MSIGISILAILRESNKADNGYGAMLYACNDISKKRLPLK